jgi:plastocyanin
MNRVAPGRFLVPVLLSASLLLVLWAGGVHAASPAVVRGHANVSVTVTVSNVFKFSPDNFEVMPGDQVTLNLEQLDGEQHTFALSSATNFSFTSANGSNDILTFFHAHPPLAYAQFNMSAGEIQTRSFVAPKLGVYEFVCTLSGHYAAGMFGLMGSGVTVGSPPGPAVPTGLYLIAGGIVGLVVLAIVLGFVVGRREGAKHEMPPERLGYAEPPAATSSGSPPPPRSGA